MGAEHRAPSAGLPFLHSGTLPRLLPSRPRRCPRAACDRPPGTAPLNARSHLSLLTLLCGGGHCSPGGASHALRGRLSPSFKGGGGGDPSTAQGPRSPDPDAPTLRHLQTRAGLFLKSWEQNPLELKRPLPCGGGFPPACPHFREPSLSCRCCFWATFPE